ncbi:unnamed protein product [Coregonus sp. 'balchen']|nr:unnamed protein product [Coregonus sp. 'balchen']
MSSGSMLRKTCRMRRTMKAFLEEDGLKAELLGEDENEENEIKEPEEVEKPPPEASQPSSSTGRSRQSDLHRYWGTKSLQRSRARAFISRNSFRALLATLYIVDHASEDNADGLRKLQYLLDHLKKICYILNVNVYTGSWDGRVVDLARKVVEELVGPYANHRYNVWFDNFYTSPPLVSSLREHGVNACGTCRVNWKHGGHQTECGDMSWCRIGGNVLAIQWRETRTVTCLSNFQNANDSTQVKRLVRQDGVWNRKAVCQPAVIHDLNRQMGGVDKSDQLINSYNVLQKTQKWKTVAEWTKRAWIRDTPNRRGRRKTELVCEGLSTREEGLEG